MRLTFTWATLGAPHQPARDHAADRRRDARRLDRAAADAYAAWRECSTALAAAYLRWTHAGGYERATAFGRYRAALEREQRAANRYAALRLRCAAGG